MPVEGQTDQPSEMRPRKARVLATALVVLCWLYVGGLVCLWLLLCVAADRWWFATVVMYAPRWVWAAPLVLLVPAALAVRQRRVWLSLSVAALVLVGPVMHFCVPWRRLVPHAATNLSLRVLTLNADDVSLNAASLKPVIDGFKPDVVVLQGWRSRNERTLFGDERGPGAWYVQRNDELFCASRFPIHSERLSADPPFAVGNGSLAAYDVQAPGGTVHLFNIHLATPRRGLLEFASQGPEAARDVRTNIDLRRRQMEVVRRWVDESLGSGGGNVIVAGDFNTPPDSTLHRQFWSGLDNAFSCGGFGFGNTHFTRRTAIRIDHILTGPGWRCRSASVGPNVGSGHRPLMATLDATPGRAQAAPPAAP